MKKLIIFLITIIGINSLSLLNVNAAGYSFSEGDYIQGIWMTKEKGGVKYYQKARFFNINDGSGRFAYCIEPFAMFNADSSYSRSFFASNLNDKQMKRIGLISYFGYNYKNHTDTKWYAITQYMIWKEANPSENMYFTDGLNGNKIDIFTDEMKEINSLVDNYLTLPSFSNITINIVEDSSYTLYDSNKVISNFSSDNSNVTINGNALTISGLKEGVTIVQLVNTEHHNNNIPIFYNSNDSQNMAISGDIDKMQTSFRINVQKTKLELTKVDSDTKTTTPRGDASLSGAVYQLYDNDMNKIRQLTINEDMTATLDNINYGKYYLKEIKAGTGYELDDKTYEFLVDTKNNIIKLSLENKVIEKEIKIHKSYGDGINSDNESNISFDIFNKNKELYKTVTTDNFGFAKTILPFGIYSVKQKNTTDGYRLSNDFSIDVNNKDKEEINLYDYKIKVPNTSKEDFSYIILFILVTLGGIYVQKKIFN